ncbi:MAG TPA: alkaline phosphatase family protein [Thermoplasmata archaeon]|nr:alkaline phosphatase family protein [Thermoplasmata archaeon]
MSAKDPSDHRLDHVVVIMFENRSFDHLLGRLYGPGEVPSFEGVLGRDLSNPVPVEVAAAGTESVPAQPTTSFATPYPDPGEEFPHVNTQLFGTVDPPSNRYAAIAEMQPPFNAPSAPPPTGPPMRGFVADYVSAFRLQMDRLPRPAEYAQIMQGYSPEQLPVLSGLARGFACFDHWFCEVPTQTYPNRSFFHAATSSGFVINWHPPGKFPTRNDAETIFERLEAARRTWRVYVDPAQILSATGIIHARRLARFFATNFGTIDDFYEDARNGQLPDYAFIEPNMFHPHTDMHPHSGARWAEELHLPPPDTLIGGEELLANVYDHVRSATEESGSNWRNTALLVTFDEHGGIFDHVPPPAAVPPDDAPGEEGFRFDRLGLRVPSVLVSAWAREGSVVTETYRSTSMIRTLRDWWDLGPPLTRRDADAPSLLPVLSRAEPRPPEQWPKLAPRRPSAIERVEEALRKIDPLDAPMERFERNVLGDALAHESIASGHPPAADIEHLSHRGAHAHFHRLGAVYFPGIARGRRP